MVHPGCAVGLGTIPNCKSLGNDLIDHSLWRKPRSARRLALLLTKLDTDPFIVPDTGLEDLAIHQVE